jgi:flagellar motor switch protein FliG
VKTIRERASEAIPSGRTVDGDILEGFERVLSDLVEEIADHFKFNKNAPGHAEEVRRRFLGSKTVADIVDQALAVNEIMDLREINHRRIVVVQVLDALQEAGFLKRRA